MGSSGAIGVFDSGIGGVTVLRELVSLLPRETFMYYGDSGNFPYGEKSAEQIREISLGIANFLVNSGCKMIVIACNASSASALGFLQEQLRVPIVGVINNGAKAAAKASKNKKICILATRFTVSNKAYVHALHAIDSTIEVSQVACPNLASAIEDGWDANVKQQELLKGYIQQIRSDVDTLVLGCTHYPIIEHDIAKLFTHNIINPALETALETKHVLESLNLCNPRPSHDKNILFCINADITRIASIVRI